MRKTITILTLAGLAGCGAAQTSNMAGNESAPTASNRVQTSGKTPVPLDQVPAPVLAAARAARPGFVPAEAEAETREGRRYFDIEGRLPDGSEIEFDIMEANGAWGVVETQRDIPFAAAPAPVQAAARAHDPALAPTRVIESTQADGLIIFEVYQGERKIELRWDGREVRVLDREWAH
jgi:hypothetical protein